ncbi:uncharacterized protein LOC142634674 [Castanea sativa]|uniref:uncharacterized protein LOC142634674 n=1 Tax=Castanea sativa TaxID=21020 RepID=UPI003F65467D
MGGFAAYSSPSPLASEDESDDGSGSDDVDEDNGASSPNDDEMFPYTNFGIGDVVVGTTPVTTLREQSHPLQTVKYLLTVSLVKEGAYALNRAGFTASESLEHSPTDFKSLIIRNILMDAGLERENTQDNLPPPSITVVDNHELPKPVLPSKKKSNWLECLRYQGNWIEETRGSLMVVATVITTITFQPAVSPPGGVWQTNVTEVSKGFGCGPSNVCLAGTSVEGSRNSNFFYHFFMFCNTLSFTASLFVIFLSISGFSLKNKFGMGFLTFAIWTTITSLALAYMSAVILVLPSKSSRALRLYEVFMTVWSLIIMMVVVLLIHIIRFLSCLVKKIRKLIIQKQRC